MSDCVPPIDPEVGFILLAAGRGKRFGRDKLTQDFRGQPLWSWVALAAEEAGFAPLHRERPAFGHPGAERLAYGNE